MVLPKEMVKLVPKNHLMSEQEWRSIGVQQSHGWVHYMTHQPGDYYVFIVNHMMFKLRPCWLGN